MRNDDDERRRTPTRSDVEYIVNDCDDEGLKTNRREKEEEEYEDEDDDDDEEH